MAINYKLKLYDAIDTALVSAKTTVAPAKIVSMPRLELHLAVLGIRLADTNKKAILSISRVYILGLTHNRSGILELVVN